jgi:ABC-type Fe3+ transport system permease subunit
MYPLNTFAQDTLSIKGKIYHFVDGRTDTIKNNAGNYVVKYIVEPEMGDAIVKNGKIYVVVMVLATIFAGIFAYLVYIDRKISRLEQGKD